MTQYVDHLSGVYGARSAEEIAELYNDWSKTYDDHMAKSGYRHPTIAGALLARYLPRGAGPVLDAGAGTGLLGQLLAILGYGPLEALDISDGMLAVARSKGVYSAFHKAQLGGDLPFADGHFGALVCTGVLTTGHVGPEALPGLYKVVRPGGVLVLTFKEKLWEESFAAKLGESEDAGIVRRLESTEPYLSMPDDPSGSHSRAVALERI